MDDMQKASMLIPEVLQRDYMAIGMDAVDKCLWPIQYMATYHPEDIPFALTNRKAMGGNTDYKVISHEGRPDVDIVIPYGGPPSGSSALLGAFAGIKLGYQKIILCGCPMLMMPDKPHNYANFQQGWISDVDKLEGKVRSMSGWTREFLGEPTTEWLSES